MLEVLISAYINKDLIINSLSAVLSGLNNIRGLNPVDARFLCISGCPQRRFCLQAYCTPSADTLTTARQAKPALTHWPMGCNFKLVIFKLILRIDILSISHQVALKWNATRPCWWLVKIGSGKGLELSWNKPLPIPNNRWGVALHMASLCNNELKCYCRLTSILTESYK